MERYGVRDIITMAEIEREERRKNRLKYTDRPQLGHPATPFDWTSAAMEAFPAEIRQRRDAGARHGRRYRELAHRLFAAATAMLENAIEAAVAGQSAKLGPRQLVDRARQLHAAARDITVIAEAAMIVANSGVNQHRSWPRRPRRKNWTFRTKQALLADDLKGRLIVR